MPNTHEHVTLEILEQLASPPGSWQPTVGEDTASLLSRYPGISSDNRLTLVQEASNILSRCVPPTESTGARTGLVVGYVQSGKTMSFTTVAALAKDNGYQLIILIAGTSVNLTEQSRQRILNDLGLKALQRNLWVIDG